MARRVIHPIHDVGLGHTERLDQPPAADAAAKVEPRRRAVKVSFSFLSLRGRPQVECEPAGQPGGLQVKVGRKEVSRQCQLILTLAVYTRDRLPHRPRTKPYHFVCCMPPLSTNGHTSRSENNCLEIAPLRVCMLHGQKADLTN